MEERHKVILMIDGILSSGKSTLLNKYKKLYPSLFIIQEPVDKWVASGLLEKFYENPKKYAYELQVFIMDSFTDQLEEAFSQDKEFILMERGHLCAFTVFSYIHWKNGNLTDEEYQKMEQKFYTYDRDLRERGYVLDHIYLNTPIDTAMVRLSNRDRINEKSKVTKEYQQQLLNRYEELCITPYTESQIDSLVAKVVEMLFGQ